MGRSMVSVQIELAALSGGDGVDDEFVRHVSVQIELAALSGENKEARRAQKALFPSRSNWLPCQAVVADHPVQKIMFPSRSNWLPCQAV